MIKKILKKQNGFATSDALIAILIIALFTGIIATIIYNIYLSNTSIKRMGAAREYITNIFEYVDKVYYDEVNIESLGNYINENQTIFDTTKNQINISSNNNDETAQQLGKLDDYIYKIDIHIEDYNKTEENTDKLDLVKQVTVTVTYKLGNKSQEIKMTRIKPRETLVTPNKPEIDLLQIADGKNAYPIKNIDNVWKVCDEKDTLWYNYENGYWATIITTTEQLSTGDEVDINALSQTADIYVWIPRYAYDESNTIIAFLYSNSNNYIDNTSGYNTLKGLEETTFESPLNFKKNEQELIGIWVNNTSSETYQNLNLVYERKM